jgi:hypothetical protein
VSDAPLPPPPDAPPPAKKKWGCLQWALLAIAVCVLLFGLCTVVVLSNLDFR